METTAQHSEPALALPTPPARRSPVASWLLAIYVVTLGMLAFWPTPVDRGVSPLLHRLIVEFHLVSYARIEFGANVLLFVPLGILLALILRQRYLIVPISIVTTVGIECAQGIFLPHRVASMGDVVANLAGACVGLLIVVGFERWKSSPARGSKTYGRPMP